MQVKGIVDCSPILSNFIKLHFVIKTFVLSIFEWPFYTGFIVLAYIFEDKMYSSSDASVCIIMDFCKVFKPVLLDRLF